ncbi:hypothetical protein [Cohnella candidum]|nr:hypothetical protein [Cohnella candidum]
MQRIRFFYKMFLREPLWFKVLGIVSLVLSILLSGSLVSDSEYAQSAAKLAAAVFFGTWAVKMRRNQQLLIVFSIVAALCIYLSWDHFHIAQQEGMTE